MTTSWPVAVDIPEAAKLADYTGIEEDLKLVCSFCDRIESIFDTSGGFDGLAVEALSVAAVIRYARCFTKGVRQRVPDELLAQLSEPHRRFHDSIFALRQRHFAHSVNAFEDNKVVAWVSDSPLETEVHGVTVQHGRIASLGRPTAKALKEVATFLLESVRRVIAEENEKVLLLARKLPYEKLRAQDMPDAFAPNWEDVDKRR